MPGPIMHANPTMARSADAAFEIAEPRAQHMASMVALFRQGQQPHHAAFPDQFGPGDNDAVIIRFLKGFQPRIHPFKKRHGFARGWFVDGALRGYLLYRLYETSDVYYGKSRWVCLVEDIVIDHHARLLGGATALIDDLMQQLARLENCSVSATVWKGNDASQALFQKHGFEALSQSFYRTIR